MRKRFSKNFVVCTMVLMTGFYLGVTLFNSDGSILNGGKANDELHETLRCAVQASHSLANDINTDSIDDDTINNVINVVDNKDGQTDANEPTSEDDSIASKLNLDFSKIGIAKTDDYVNVRQKASTSGSIVGKMSEGAFAVVLDKADGWYKIQSGKVSGYVREDFLIVGDEAANIYDQYVYLGAKITADVLKVRKEGSADAAVVASVKKNSVYKVLTEGKEWVEIQVKNKVTGYVSAEYVTIDVMYDEAKTLEQVVISETASELLNSASGSYSIADSGVATELNDDDFTIFVALIFCESGSEPYDGKLGVANVILNRMHSSRYPNSISGVAYQSGQFTPARNGMLKTNIARYKSGKFTSKNHKECITAAKAAMKGFTIVGSRCNFHVYKPANDDKISNKIIIKNHVFY